MNGYWIYSDQSTDELLSDLTGKKILRPYAVLTPYKFNVEKRNQYHTFFIS